MPYSTPFTLTGSGADNLLVRSTDLAGNVEPAVSQNLLVAPSAAVRPVLECVVVVPGGGYRARFGYRNDNPVAVTLAIGGANKFTPNPQNRTQPTVFQPGRQVGVFEVLAPVATWCGR